ncbi:MAG: ABC transporter ATP-binding protein/permease [Alphaproteobacteria bacterium]|nr:ABC transporter ATP-binding protein/permease [Alphaproteobacteria bacterium SS10]
MTDVSSTGADDGAKPATAPSQDGALEAEKLTITKDRGGLNAVLSFLPYLWPKEQLGLRIRVVAAMVALVLAKMFSVYTPVLFADAVDVLTGVDEAVAANPVIGIPVLLILAYGLARVLSLAFNELRDALFARVAQRGMRRFGLQVFGHLHSLSLRFHLERQTGGLSRAIDRGTRSIEEMLQFALFSIIPTILELLLVAIILWSMFDLTFAVVTIATVGGYMYFTIKVTEWRLKYRREMNESEEKANTRAIDSLINFETVKYFGNERHEHLRYDVALQKYEEAAVRSQLSLSALNVGQAIIISVGISILLYLSAQAIISGEMTVGGFVLVHTYLLQLYQPLSFFGFVYRAIRQAVIDLEKMFGLLDEPAEVTDKLDAVEMPNKPPVVRFENVEFGYDERRPILKGITFEVPAGNKVALVGPSGAGKSTIARLLFRFYDVTGGAVTVDGTDLRDISQTSLRSGIGIVPQDTVLFNDTIRYNLDYGRPGATDDDIAHAAQVAQIDGFIEALPDGYETMVGERGLKLSGGEKQRVAIARSVLKDPAIMIFDEATSALDTATERAIQSNLVAVSEGRTTLVIAHRLSTVVDSDEILVLVDGRIEERGTHDQLLALGGTYAAMWQQQQQAEETERGVSAEARQLGELRGDDEE